MVEEPDRRTMTLRWETAYCERCRDRTTFLLVSEGISRCSKCDLERDRSQGLGIDPATLER